MNATKGIWKLLAAAGLALGLAAGGSLAADAHRHEHDHGAAPARLELNNGKKWETDAPLRQGMENIRGAMEAARHGIHDKKYSAAQYGALAKKVNGEVNGIVCCLDGHFIWTDESHVGGRNDPAPGVSVRTPEGVKLFQIGQFDPCFFFQFPPNADIQVFIHVQETTGECPAPTVRFTFPTTLDEKNPEGSVFGIKGKDNGISGVVCLGVFVDMCLLE